MSFGELSAAFEELHFPLVFDGSCARGECAQISSFTGFRVLLARIEAVLA